MEFLLSKLLTPLLSPLGLALLLQLAGLGTRRRRAGPWLHGAGLILLWLASMPLLSRALVQDLEQRGSRLTPTVLPRADAVLVLGGGVRPPLPPRRGVELGEAGDRLLTGIALLRQGRAPLLLLSGGRVSFTADDPSPPEAESAARLARELGVPAERLRLNLGPGPDGPRNTAEEAINAARLAQRHGWRSLLLVTSASHLPRALATFQQHLPPQQGVRLIPVAADHRLADEQGNPTAASLVLDLLPSAAALADTSQTLREHAGLLLYRLRGWAR